MNKNYITYRCKTCSKHFALIVDEVKHSEEESSYITCPYHGRHNRIIVVGRYDNLKECMQHDSYEKVKGRTRNRR